MQINNDYKKFTAEIQTQTLLDDFAPQYIEDIARRFSPIQSFAIDYMDSMRRHVFILREDAILTSAADVLEQSISDLNEVFSDFRERMKYFTLVFFGAVSAGKTSLICDLANINPPELTRIISSQNNFDFERDRISIGPNVATVNLYEILIEKSCIRLVDVPGIGGVIHENETLAPFVNMADCIIFLIPAGGDIKKDDENFLYNHVAGLPQKSKDEQIEKVSDKKILIVFNMWNTHYRFKPANVADREFEQKKEWILYGRDKFKGIAGFFNPEREPEVVRSTTQMRDDETGEPYQGQDEVADLRELVLAIKQIFEEEGASLRLNRPRQILESEFTRIISKITQEKTNLSLEKLTQDLERVGIKIGYVSEKVRDEIAERLDSIEERLASYFNAKIGSALKEWKPKVGILNGLKGAVPEWVPLAKDAGLGKTAMQEALKIAWSEELKPLFAAKLDADEIRTMVTRDIKSLTRSVQTTFQTVLLEAPQLHNKFSNKQSNENALTIYEGETEITPYDEDSSLTDVTRSEPSNEPEIFATVDQQIQQVVRKIEMGIMDDVISIVTVDLILAIVAGALLTPFGSALIVVWRRWRRGEKKGKEAKEEMENVISDISRKIAADIRTKVEESVGNEMESVHSQIMRLLGMEHQNIVEPKRKLDRVLQDVNQFQFNLSRLDI